MATTQKYLTYRGDLQAIVTCGAQLAFTTSHSENIPTALYRLDVEKFELSSIPLDCGGLSLASSDGNLWLGGDDGGLYQISGNSVSKIKVDLPAPASLLTCLSEHRLAAVCDDQLLILETKKGKRLQAFELQEKGTALGASPAGDWLAVGTGKGQVTVFESEESASFQLSESEKIHEGAVTAILFEPEELRFLSAGADQKLMLTHARGKLEPEDRGRGAGHADQITRMLHVPGDRFVTVSRDKSCKTWARGDATRPATFDDSVPVVRDAALIDVHERPHLVLAGEDNTLRFVLLDAGGRFSSMTHRLYDAYDRAAHLLDDKDVGRRGEAVHALANYNDTLAVELLAERVEQESDHGLRLRTAQLLAKSDHPRAARLLEPLLKHRDEKVRAEALDGLRRSSGADDLHPLTLAISAERANIGVAAVKALGALAKKDELARQLLVRTLSRNPEEVRRAALLQLESVFAKDSPEPSVIAIKSDKADMRQLALIRSYQRKLLDNSRIAGVVRRSGEDPHADVRRTAFLVALFSRTKLAQAIRERDPELHRQLFELEHFTVDPQEKPKRREAPKLTPGKLTLDVDDYEPLLAAMASRVLDTCLLGARSLALLGDARALGTLLQLSREEDAPARVQVCQALAALADARAAQRLETLVNDAAAEVRDAAYTALENIYQKQPLEAADIGLKSAHVDVRRRALKTLASAIRKTKAKKIDDRAQQLMLRALNDSDDKLSGEAFKTTLGLKIDGNAHASLRFALGSVRDHVRHEVLTETMAQDKEEWAHQLLIDLLDDPTEHIRKDAFEHLLGEKKGRDIAPMQAALKSRYVDVRLLATHSLIKLKTDAAQQALVSAIDDDHPKVRAEALEALVHINAVDILQQAMASQHADVRLRAACARALYHDEQAQAPLVQAATAPVPERDADKPRWEQNAIVALDGLATLGFGEVIPLLVPLLSSDNGNLRKAAATAISRCARPTHVDLLKTPLQHEDAEVRFRIALALAFCQEPVALPMVFSDEAGKVLSEKDRLLAAVTYGELTETHLATLLDSSTAWIRNAAFLILLVRDWREHDGTPARVLTALSAQDPRIRIAAAKALETFGDEREFASFLIEFMNDRGDDRAWEISPEQISVWADAVVFSPPHVQVPMVECLETLTADDQTDWNFTCRVLEMRYGDAQEAAAKAAAKRKLPELANSREELSSLAFGTYVGLVREQGGYHQRRIRPSFGTNIIGIRQAAMRQLVRLATAESGMAAAGRPVLIQTLSDELQAVRLLAFEQLAEIGLDDETRAAAAIECGHTDLAVEALKLLTSGAGKQGSKILADVVLSRDDELAVEAGNLLLEMTDAVTAAKVGLESPSSMTRVLAVGWLALDYDNTKSKKALIAAYKSPYEAVQRDVAIALATRQDEHAFEMLMEQLPRSSNKRMQSSIIDAIVVLGDARSPAALLQALEADKEKRLDPGMIFSAIGRFRQVDSVEQLLPLLENREWRTDVAKAIVRISGYDQPCQDTEDIRPNRDWLDEQHPRHDEVLAKFLARCLELSLTDLIKPRIMDARWSLTGAVDPVLALLAVHPDEDVRDPVVSAMGWRFKRRSGPADSLVELLEHRSTITKFLAAVGLARGGRADGINILLSAVELMTDLSQRILAVEALGELADEQSLDVLLRLASEDGHALQDTATEAIGHLGNSEKSDAIFELLKRLSNSTGTVATRAIVGLRWFNTPAGWDLIREKVHSLDDYPPLILEQLSYNDDPATRAILLDALKAAWVDEILPAAKRLFGADSLEPDYAALQSEYGYYADSSTEDTWHCLARVCENGEPEKILEIIPVSYCSEELAAALMQREPLPVEAAAKAFSSPQPQVIEVAASIVGRAATKDNGKPLGSAIEQWLAIWTERYEESIRDGGWNFHHLDEVTSALQRMAWAAGRTSSGKRQLIALLQTHEDIEQFAAIRQASILALAECKLTKTDLAIVENLAHDSDAIVRQSVAEILVKQDATRAVSRAGELLSDRSAFQRLLASPELDISAAVVEAAAHPHYQAVALPRLVEAEEIERLTDVAQDSSLGDGTRLGAVEGLARIANSSADEQLVNIGRDESNSEDLRKAAWRGLRRSQRAQAK